MKTFLHMFVFGVALVAVSAASAEDNSLFSNVRVDSVFARSRDRTQASPESAAPSPNVSERITDAGQLSRLLGKAGFDAKEVGSKVVATKAQNGTWSFPVLVTISADESQIGIALLLSKVEDEELVPASKLLALMDANRQYAPSYFAYSSTRKRTELYHLIKNQSVTSSMLRDDIDRLAQIARDTESLWKFDGTSTPMTETRADSPPAAVPTSLIGNWSAVRSEKEAFAIQFSADGKFKLIYVKQGQQSKSTGKFLLSGESLTLLGDDGFRMTGTLNNKSDREFQLSLSKTAILTFKKAA
jgi:hypothetical protein